MKKECEKHGEYESEKFNLFGKDAWSECPECMNEFNKERESEIEKKEALDRQDRIIRQIDYARIPERFKSCTFNNYKVENPGQQKAYTISRKYYENYKEVQKTGSSLFYCGNYGTGKTHLAIAILMGLIIEGTSTGIYTTTMRMIRDIRSSYNNNKRSEQDIIDDYTRTPLLVLDEVGVQFGTDAEKILIYEVVNGRYENYRPTILISNLSFTEMTEYLGARSIDRLKSKSGSMVVMDWESWRNK